MTELVRTWNELAAESPHGSSGIAFRRLPEAGSCGLRLLLQQPNGCRGLAIDLKTEALPAKLRLENTEGYRVEILTESGGSRSTTVTLISAAVEFNDVFGQMIEEVVNESSHHDDQRSAIVGVSRRLDAWAQFFRRLGHRGLSIEAQRGLFAELLVLRDYLLVSCDVEAATEAWTGPSGRPHDFIRPHVSLEVKSTIGAAAGSIEIASARQLDELTAGRRLILVVHYLEPVPTGAQSLPELVSDLARRVATAGTHAQTSFRDGLRAAGYEENASLHYSNTRLVSRSVQTFDVTYGFPRLLEKDIPPGVEGVRYRVLLGACDRFRIANQEVLQLLKAC